MKSGTHPSLVIGSGSCWPGCGEVLVHAKKGNQLEEAQVWMMDHLFRVMVGLSPHGTSEILSTPLMVMFSLSPLSSSRMFLGNFSGIILRPFLSILPSVCSFPPLPFSLSFLSQVLVSFILTDAPPHSLVHFQQTSPHNDCHISKEDSGRGCLATFFSVKFLLLITRNKEWRRLSTSQWLFFTWRCSLPCPLPRILHRWVEWMVSLYRIMCNIH